MHARVAVTPSDARPVVLLHGLGVSSRYLLPFAARLTPEYQALAPDLPGFGRSPPSGHRPSIGRLASALAGWLDAVGVARAPVVAHSFGCQVAVELAVREPERITELVLVGPSVDRAARSVAVQLARFAVDSTREPPSLLALIALDYTAFAARGGLALVRPAVHDAIERKLPEVHHRALVVSGSRDVITPTRWAREVAARLPNGELRVIERAPHASTYTHAGALTELVRAFLGDRTR